MKNVYLLPTDKPSKIGQSVFNKFLHFNPYFYELEKERVIPQNIYITSSDEEIKEGDWHINLSTNEVEKASKYLSINFISQSNFGISVRKQYKKIILTDNKDLVKDGVQAIDDEFLEWFVKNPDCEWVDVDTRPKVSSSYEKGFVIDNPNYNKITIPKEKRVWDINTCKYFNREIGCVKVDCVCEKEEPKQETLEEKAKWSLEKAQDFASERFKSEHKKGTFTWDAILQVLKVGVLTGHKFGAKWQQEQFKNESTASYIDRHIVEAMVETAKQKMYSETEVLQLLLKLQQTESYDNLYDWFEQNKKK